MSGETGYCAWTFKRATDCPYADPFVARFKFLLDTFGLCFPDEHQYPWEIIRKFSMEPQSLTDREWGMTKYPFLPTDRQALIKLQKGYTNFSKAEIGALEEICGDFFDLNGKPRHNNHVVEVMHLAA